MARTINALTMGLAGNVRGLGLTFRRSRSGGIHVMTTPQASTKPPTAAQQATRDQFREAAAAGREAVKDPATKAFYQQFVDDSTPSAYAAAMQDRLIAPTIKEVHFDEYLGKPGDQIRITAFDNFGVARVTVLIQNPDQSVVEEGDAVRSPGTLDWIYTATADNESLGGDVVTIHAFDHAGNNITYTQTLD